MSKAMFGGRFLRSCSKVTKRIVDEIAPCVASASSRIIVKGILDSGHKGICFDTVTILALTAM